MNLLLVQTQNISTVRESPSHQDQKKLKFTKETVMREFSDVFGEQLGRVQGKVHLETDPEASDPHCFATQTTWGRYRWHRIPLGITPAPEKFQMKLDQNLEGLNGVFKIADDILITGQGDTQHDADEDHE